MGILNVTPDSFSDGGRFLDPDAAVAHGRSLFEEGADIVDVGGESTRPGAEPVAVDEELGRVLPVIEELSRHGRVSIDTRRAPVAEAALASGATVLNDVSASLHGVAARAGAAWIAMHMRGEPRTMQLEPSYDDVVAEVVASLSERARVARSEGVEEIWIDPGIGFGKSVEHNLRLLRHLDVLVATGHPVVVGTSRKSFLGALTGGAPVGDRLEASIATAVWAARSGARMVRVHDVAATVAAVRVAAEPVRV